MAANIIDALVVTLGLDARDYDRGSRGVRDDLKRTREESGRTAVQIESDGKRAANFFRALRNEAVGLFLAFAGANSLKSFASGLLENEAASGRLAKNIGLATSELIGWQGALRTVGGDAKDANNALATMTQLFQNLQLTGTTGHDADLQGLGVTPVDLRNPAQALLKIAQASQHMSQPEFYARAQRLGLSDSTINLLEKGRDRVARLVDEQARMANVTEDDIRAAQQFQERLANLQTLIEGKARPGLTDLITLLLNVTTVAFQAKTPIDGLTAALRELGRELGFTQALQKIFNEVSLAGDAIRHGQFGQAWQHYKTAANTPLFPGTSDYTPLPENGASSGGTGGRSGAGGLIGLLTRNGFSAEQARGIQAGIYAESGGDPNAVNPSSGAFGIGQWLGGRKRELFRRYGPNPTAEQQLEYLLWELNGGDAGGKSVKGAGSADAALYAYITKFMRPAAGAETIGDLARGRAYLGGARMGSLRTGGVSHSTSTSTTSVGQVTIYTAATDAKGIARDLRGALAERNVVVQSNSGIAQ